MARSSCWIPSTDTSSLAPSPVSWDSLERERRLYWYVEFTSLDVVPRLIVSHSQDVLANRKTIGVIGGSVLIDGRPIGTDFQRSTAYVEQQDTHESTATVREAFRFSAYLRQPAHVSREEKDRYVRPYSRFDPSVS